MIGFFGDVVFETSDSRLLTFNGFTREVSSRYAEHEVLLKKPKIEYLGPGLDTITFTIDINGSFGVKPREEMDRWVVLARKGQAYTLVIGAKPLGSDKWVVERVSEAWEIIFNRGELYSGKIDVTLKEYISTK